MICLSSCGGLKVKWWFLDGTEEMALIRRDHEGSIVDRLEFKEADGHWCLSRSDAEALLNYCTTKEPKP
jgi:hypothetical protein